MAGASHVIPSAALRDELVHRGAGTLSRCYQCATCSSVCALSTPGITFPRTQMLLAQWGLENRLAADPAVWLCHQCTDCSERCPRDARPGDVLQALRAAVIERLAFPRALGRLVGRAAVTWPLLLLAPWLFWVLLLWLTGRLEIPPGEVVFEKYVPHGLIYAVFFPAAGWACLAAWMGGRRFWRQLGSAAPRRGSFLGGLVGILTDIAVHKRFSSCETVSTRRWGHLALLWGFVGAAVTSGLLILAIYVMHEEMPLSLWHPFKILGNISALLLVIGGVILVVSRFWSHRTLIKTSAFDLFFLGVVLLVIATGVIIEAGRFLFPASAAYALYTVHLGVVLTLFLTFPYSKFAHMLYRTLALVHQRMTADAEE